MISGGEREHWLWSFWKVKVTHTFIISWLNYCSTLLGAALKVTAVGIRWGSSLQVGKSHFDSMTLSFWLPFWLPNAFHIPAARALWVILRLSWNSLPPESWLASMSFLGRWWRQFGDLIEYTFGCLVLDFCCHCNLYISFLFFSHFTKNLCNMNLFIYLHDLYGYLSHRMTLGSSEQSIRNIVKNKSIFHLGVWTIIFTAQFPTLAQCLGEETTPQKAKRVGIPWVSERKLFQRAEMPANKEPSKVLPDGEI